MPSTTKLADWQQLTARNGVPGEPDPTTTVTRMLGEHVDDYDVEALTGAYVEHIRDAIDEIDNELFLAADGELFGGAGRLYQRPIVDEVRQAIEELDFYELAEFYDKTAGPYRIACRHVLGEKPGEKPQVYEFEAALGITRAEAIAEAEKRYGQETGYDPEEITHLALDEKEAPAQPTPPPRPVDREPAMESAEIPHDAECMELHETLVNGVPLVPLDHWQSPPATPEEVRRCAVIRTINAVDLVHRTVTNPNGAEFHIDGLKFDARSGQVVIQLSPYDEEGELIPDAQVGVFTLAGWTIQ